MVPVGIREKVMTQKMAQNGIRAQGMDMKNKSKILLSSETLR